MKLNFKKSLSFLMVILFMVFAFGLKVKAAEVVESVDFTTIAAKHSAYTDKWTYDGWTVSGGANNNGGWAYVKMGGKSTNLSSYSTIYIASPVVASETSKVEVNIIAGSVAKSGMSATVSLEVYSDSTLNTKVDSTAAQSVTKSAALMEFVPSGTNWPANSYFKVVFTCANTSTTNGIVWLDNISIYDYDSAAALEPSVEVSGEKVAVVGGDALEFTAALNNTTSDVKWSVDNENVATIEDGVLTPVAMGTVTVTAALASDESVNDSIEVTVFPEDGSELTIAEALLVCDWCGTAECAYTYLVTGVVETINTEYNSTYNNITVTVTDGTNSIQAYRMTGGSDLVVGDKIAITGTLTKYSGNTSQFTAGATYEAVQDEDYVAKAKEALNEINAYMSLAYKFDYEEVTQSATNSAEFVSKELGYANGVAVEEISDNGVTITFDKGTNSNAPKYYTTGEGIRCYGSNTFTVSSASTIKSIELTFGSGDGTNTITANSGTYADGVWTGEATEVVFTISGTSGHRRIASFVVNCAGGEGTVLVPTYSNVEFRLRCGVDSAIANIENIEEYGIFVSTSDKEAKYSVNLKSDDTNNVTYTLISLGDVLNNPERLSVEFTVQAYVVVDGVTYLSELSKTYSVESLFEVYSAREDTAELTAVVELGKMLSVIKNAQ